MRQPDSEVADPELLARSFGVTCSPGYAVPPHAHGWDQFIWTATGAIRVIIADELWLVPAGRALWIPAGTVHAVEAPTRAELRALFLHPASIVSMGRACKAIEMSPLLRELAMHVVRVGTLRRENHHESRCFLLFGDLIGSQPTVALALPMPHDPRGRRVAQAILDRPGDRAGVPDLARVAFASRRTLERIFRAETGLAIGRWRRKARLLSAIELLAAGEAVATVGPRVGYRSTSAFIGRFKEEFGVTPGRYAREQT